MKACKVASKILVKFLVKNGAAINIKNDMYRTALFYNNKTYCDICYSKNGTNTLIKFLIDNGADVNIKYKKGWSTLYILTDV
ncbi:hypothetical protein U3516DRAFT_738664 [Neocallimastix sp. 'constans']